MEKRKRTPKSEVIKERTHIYQEILETMYEHGEAWASMQAFNLVFGLWKEAARECDLRFRKGCLYTRNNRLRFPFIYLPHYLYSVPNDLGQKEIVLYGGFWFRVEPKNRIVEGETVKGYRLLAVYLKEDAYQEEAFADLEDQMRNDKQNEDGVSRCIKRTTFKSLIGFYSKILARKTNIERCPLAVTKWLLNEKSGKPERYWFVDDTILDDNPYDPFRIFKNEQLLSTPLSRVLLCLTLFSVSKPLLSAAKVPTDFVLHLSVTGAKDQEESYNCLHNWICYYCNPNKCQNYYSDYENFERNFVELLSPVTHHHFPILFQKYDLHPKRPIRSPRDVYFSQNEVDSMAKATALPVLISPIIISKRKGVARCLLLTIPRYDKDTLSPQLVSPYRNQVFEFYSGYINYLNIAPANRINEIKQYFKKALADLQCDRKSASTKQLQIAGLLTTLRLAEEYIKENNACLFDPFLKTKSFLKSFASKHTAVKGDFAGFLKKLTDQPENHFPLLMQDEQFLYLDFKGYWGKFEEYCNLYSIVIDKTEKEFRKMYLTEEFLKPQYRAKPGTYPRYDCRKLIGTEKKTVLVVKKEILQYARKPAKAKN